MLQSDRRFVLSCTDWILPTDNPVELPELGGHWALLRRDDGEFGVVAKMDGLCQRAAVTRMGAHAQRVHHISAASVQNAQTQRELMDA